MYSIYQYFGYDLSLEERFALIKATGFDAVGLWRDDWFEWTGHRAFADKARAAGLQVIDGHAPFMRDYDFVNSLWLDNLNGESTYQTYRDTIDAAGEDGVENLIIHLEELPAPPPNELGIQRIRRLVETAENRGVTIAVENIHDNSYLSYVFERVQSPNLGFCYDAGHRNCKRTDGRSAVDVRRQARRAAPARQQRHRRPASHSFRGKY